MSLLGLWATRRANHAIIMSFLFFTYHLANEQSLSAAVQAMSRRVPSYDMYLLVNVY